MNLMDCFHTSTESCSLHMCCSTLPFILLIWFLDCLKMSGEAQCTTHYKGVFGRQAAAHTEKSVSHITVQIYVFSTCRFSQGAPEVVWVFRIWIMDRLFMIQQRFYIYCTKWKLINQGIGSSQSIINTCDKEIWCLYHTNNANTKIMGKLLFLIYYLMDFFSAVYITHYDINFNSYSLKSPWGGRGIQKNILSVQRKNSCTVVQSNGLERNMITVPVTLGCSLLSSFLKVCLTKKGIERSLFNCVLLMNITE